MNLAEVLEQHLLWLDNKGGECAKLRGAKLIKADLSGLEFAFADLRDADLIRANLREANLNGANLTAADLSGADLTGANLRNASLRFANVEGVTWPDGKPTASIEESDALAREIAQQVLANPLLLDMDYWHRETSCGTTHCLAGWAQWLTDGSVADDGATLARGLQLLPTLKHLFFEDDETALEALQSLLGK